jgi:hypothetical protein
MLRLLFLLAPPLFGRPAGHQLGARAALDSIPSAACESLARAESALPEAAADVRATLAVHNGAVRWDVARGPVRLWVQRRPRSATDVNRPRRAWEHVVRDAAAAWHQTTPGLEFRTWRDSATADVIVTWEHVLREPSDDASLASSTAGRTTFVPAADGRATAARVRLAVFAPTGVPYALADTRAVATHELGHALGLAHHASATSVMAPLVTADRPSAGDREALRLLYSLPIGARCPGPATLARQ